MRIIGLDGATRSIGFRAWPTAARRRLVAVHGIAADVTGRLALERVLKATVGATRREADALEARTREAEHRARTDALTGVCNRRHLDEVLAAELDRARAGAAAAGRAAARHRPLQAHQRHLRPRRRRRRAGGGRAPRRRLGAHQRHHRALGRRGVLRAAPGHRRRRGAARDGRGRAAADRGGAGRRRGPRARASPRPSGRRARPPTCSMPTTSSTPPTARCTRRSAAAATRCGCTRSGGSRTSSPRIRRRCGSPRRSR